MTLYIKNFQAIEEETINLEGFTVLTGNTNSGKSSVRRALELVLYNVWDKGHLRVGSDLCIVKLTIDEDNWIQITKPENNYTVCIAGDKSIYPKIGRNTLEELYDLELDHFLDSEGFEHSVHIRKQVDSWFYIASSKQEQSRIIASIFNFDQIKSILKESYTDKKTKTNKAIDIAEDIDGLKVTIDKHSVREKLLKCVHTSLSSKKILLDYGTNSDSLLSLQSQKDISTATHDIVILLLYNLNNYSHTRDFASFSDALSVEQSSLKTSQLQLENITEQITTLTRYQKNLEETKSINKYIADLAYLKNGNNKSDKLESNLKSLRTLRNKVIRADSLKRYLSRNKTIDKYKTILLELTTEKTKVKELQDKVNLVPVLYNYYDVRAKLSTRRSEGTLLSDRLIDVKDSIKGHRESLEGLEGTLVCEECGHINLVEQLL